MTQFTLPHFQKIFIGPQSQLKYNIKAFSTDPTSVCCQPLMTHAETSKPVI